MTITLASLFAPETYTTILNKGLDLAATHGLPVTTWRAGDPTKSVYEYLATVLETLEGVYQEHIRGGFLAFATDDWLDIHGEQTYGVTRTQATYATSQAGKGVTLSNGGGGFYEIEPGQLTFKSTATGKTYHNTTGDTLESGPGTTLVVEFIADEEGTASSVSANEIDTLVTTLLGVTISASDAAFAADAQTDQEFRDLCTASLGALSPAGPADAYRFVALNPELTGNTETTKVGVFSDAPTGEVTVYLAGPSGAVSGGAVTAVSDAIAEWAVPLTVTPTLSSASSVTVDVDVTVYVRESYGISEADAEALVEEAIEELFVALPIGGDEGFLHVSRVIAVCFAAVSPGAVYNVTVANPSADVALSQSQVAALGAVAVSVVLV